jgi:hypothetical protein
MESMYNLRHPWRRLSINSPGRSNNRFNLTQAFVTQSAKIFMQIARQFAFAG